VRIICGRESKKYPEVRISEENHTVLSSSWCSVFPVWSIIWGYFCYSRNNNTENIKSLLTAYYHVVSFFLLEILPSTTPAIKYQSTPKFYCSSHLYLVHSFLRLLPIVSWLFNIFQKPHIFIVYTVCLNLRISLYNSYFTCLYLHCWPRNFKCLKVNFNFLPHEPASSTDVSELSKWKTPSFHHSDKFLELTLECFLSYHTSSLFVHLEFAGI
jgi:hypothetical protein